MSLSIIIRLMGFMLTAFAALPLFLSGEIKGTLLFLFGTGLSVAVMIGVKGFSNTIERLLKVIVFVAIFIIGTTGFDSSDRLLISINFLFLVTLMRGMRLKTSRHFFQLIGLSFLILVVSAIVNLDISFAGSFFIYTILLTWTLIYTNIVQQVEGSTNPDIISSRASQLITGKFLLGSSLLGVGLLISSLTIFILFPRVSLGLFTPTKQGEQVIGFSDTIKLGHFGILETSGRTIMRLEMVKGEELVTPSSPLYLRGISFDHYDGQTWSKSVLQKKELVKFSSQGYLTNAEKHQVDTNIVEVLEYNIFQEPLNNDYPAIFSIPPFKGIKAQYEGIQHGKERMKFFEDEAGDISHNQANYLSLNYTVRSNLSGFGVSEILDTAHLPYSRFESFYTKLPNDLDLRIPKLARELSSGSNSPYQSALMIEQSLKLNYNYSIIGLGKNLNPIANFLFDRKEGHCEYFSTAMVIMLRSMEIPARPVNGFIGAKYNSFGDYYIVKEGNAHSWVEGFFPDRGWIRFDPTPVREIFQSNIGQFSLFLDSFRLKWYKWVISFNLNRQIILYTSLWNAFLPDEKELEPKNNISAREFGGELKKAITSFSSWKAYVFLFSPIFLVIGFRFIKFRYKDQKIRRQSPWTYQSERLKKILKRKGFSIYPGSTLLGLSRQADKKYFSAKAELNQLVETIYRGRWDPSETNSSQDMLKKLVKKIKSATFLGQRQS